MRGFKKYKNRKEIEKKTLVTATGIEPVAKRLAKRFSLKGYLEPKWLR